MIESQLQQHQIPVLKKHRGAGGYVSIYMGRSNLGIDLYVPSALLEKAHEIIKVYKEEIETDIDEKDEVEEKIKGDWEVSYNKKRRIKIWILILFIIPGFTWIIISMILNLLQQFI
ncbi:hypothetical protein RH915_10195 [Serpentinicella sp. ANB-PHB4]|uniref:hypothetical protein n=1 Tax=Serpentinicella sp. ANB-PHB4 TaxID=3074076 RepID=UPI002860D8C4|nr:hypothetical protein [Serpentinicella sp. ANB-PHB4]MDR5659859.1 hypothetical protein [Serpentinicella sp. ANB-PHB4]